MLIPKIPSGVQWRRTAVKKKKEKEDRKRAEDRFKYPGKILPNLSNIYLTVITLAGGCRFQECVKERNWKVQ